MEDGQEKVDMHEKCEECRVESEVTPGDTVELEAQAADVEPMENSESQGESQIGRDDMGQDSKEIPVAPEGEKPVPKAKKFKVKGADDAKIKAMEAELAELKDKNLRQMAEFDNYRKRTDKEKAAMFDTGARSVIEKILPIVDNFERGLAALTEEERSGSFAQGMDKVYRQLEDTLDKMDVKPIEAQGQPFNPDLHNAVQQVEAPEGTESGTVVTELQKGYTYHDIVVRHSMVAVAS